MRELFISYKRTDETKAFDIIQILEKQLGAYSCWIDTTGIESGEYFRDTIMSAIRNSSVVLFLMSKNSVISPSTAPTWVQKEVLYAIKKGKKVMPISIDGTKLDDCDWLLFECGELDFIDWNIHKQRQKLIDNLTNWKIVRDYNKDFKDQIQVETDGDKGGSKQDHNYSTENIGLIIWTVVSVISLICVYLAIYYRTNIALQYKAIFGLCAGITLILLMASLINPKILFFNKKKFVLLYLLPLLLFTSAVSSGIEETDTIPSSEMINDINVYWSVECTESQKETVRDILKNMVYVEGGSAQIGSEGTNSFKDEYPIHQVNIKDFHISKFELTQAQWNSIMGYNPAKFKGDNNPVENVSYNDITYTFLPKLKNLTGLDFRLPSEEEWEFAADGGNKTLNFLFSGSNQLSEVGWYEDNSSKKHYPVGSMNKANELGLYDMSGNVWEWTSSLWSDNYEQPRQGGSTGNFYVRRGGSWFNDSKHCTNTCRGSNKSNIRSSDLGFRIAL